MCINVISNSDLPAINHSELLSGTREILGGGGGGGGGVERERKGLGCCNGMIINKDEQKKIDTLHSPRLQLM